MKNVLLSVIMTVLLPTLFSCNKDSRCPGSHRDCLETCPVESLAQAEQRLPGEWEWVRSYARNRGGEIIETPANTGKRILHQYERDRLRIFENGSLTRELRYELQFNDKLTISHFDLQSNQLVAQLEMHLSKDGACFTISNPWISVENQDDFRRK